MPNPRQPDDVLKIRGTYRATRHKPKPKTAPTWPAGAPRRPSWLSPRAADEWRRVVPVLAAAGVLSPMDRAVLVAYCETYVSWLDTVGAARAADDADEHRLLQRIAHQLYGDWMKAADALGLSPKSRRQIRPLEPGADADTDKASAIIGLIGGPDPREGA